MLRTNGGCHLFPHILVLQHHALAEPVVAARLATVFGFALAHQAAYCLAAAFPACPTFADWARREAAPPAERRSSDGRVVAPEPGRM